MRGRDGASTNVPIPPRDESDGRVSGHVQFMKQCRSTDLQHNLYELGTLYTLLLVESVVEDTH